MEIVILKNSDEVAIEGASLFRRLLSKKKNANLGLATGSTPVALYQQLINNYKEGKVSFRDVTTFNLDEYIGIKPSNPQSYRSTMQQDLFAHIDIKSENTYLPECLENETPQDVGLRYEALIVENGGIDLQLLGIGKNGHIGFNEPTSSLSSRTRIKTLTSDTLKSNRRFFNDSIKQPELAITMGIATIMDADCILLLATGKDKANAVQQSFEGSISSMWPASMLQLHEKVIVLLDEDAASLLTLNDYYHWVRQQKNKLLNPADS